MNLLTITNEVLKIKNVSIKCVRILDIVPETQKFFIMTVRTITLKSNKKMNLKNTEKAKNIVQILS